MKEKIKKLLSLAESSNQHEAKLALEKAYTLMHEHNFSLQEINDVVFDYGSINIERNRKSVEDKFIMGILINYFFIRVVNCNGNVEFSGKPDNVLVAYDLYGFLTESFRNCWRKEKQLNDFPADYKQSYYYGFTEGIISNLKTKKVELEEKGLILVDDKALSAYIKDKYPNLQPTRQNYNLVSNSARSNGYIQGKALNLYKGIS